MTTPTGVPQNSRLGFPPAYALSVLFLLFAFLGIAAIVGWDCAHRMSFTLTHQRLDAFPLTMIGLSYISFQAGARSSKAERIKGALLGFAFVFWGADQVLQATRLVTFMDEAVVTIFVVDVGLIICGRLSSGV